MAFSITLAFFLCHFHQLCQDRTRELPLLLRLNVAYTRSYSHTHAHKTKQNKQSTVTSRFARNAGHPKTFGIFYTTAARISQWTWRFTHTRSFNGKGRPLSKALLSCELCFTLSDASAPLRDSGRYVPNFKGSLVKLIVLLILDYYLESSFSWTSLNFT